MNEEEIIENKRSQEAKLTLWAAFGRADYVEGPDLETLRMKLRDRGYAGQMLQVRADKEGEAAMIVGWVNHNSYAWRPPADLA